jgi:putative DNA primase/helicase
MSAATDILGMLDDAPALDNPLNGLVERTQADPSAPFEPAVLEALADLRATDTRAFQAMRIKLKGAKCGVTALDDAINALTPSGADAELEPLVVARRLLASTFLHSVHWQGEFRRFRAGAYHVVEDGAVRRDVYHHLDEQQISPNARRVSDVIDALRGEAHLSRTITPPCGIDGADLGPLLHFPNGTLDLATGELLAPDPSRFVLNTLDVEHNSDAATPIAWLRFLDSIWHDDPETIDTLQEVMGYLLTCRTEQQKLFLIVGPRRSGKGTIFRVITDLLGRGNVAAPTLATLTAPFGLQALVGKQAALISDARLSGRTDQAIVAERLLSISGEDHVSISRKFQEDHTGRLPVRFVIATNELPRLSDSSGALASRFLILMARRSFYGAEDHSLYDRLRPELPGILQWSIEGLRRLTDRGRFVQPRSAQDAVRVLEDLGSPISAFLRDECTLDPMATVEVDRLYSAWKQWCEDSGRGHATNKEVFARDLLSAQPMVRRYRPRSEDARVNMYRGVRLGTFEPVVRGGQGSSLFVRTHGGRVFEEGDTSFPGGSERNRADPRPPLTTRCSTCTTARGHSKDPDCRQCHGTGHVEVPA